jgi:tungstate transport system substrate-binding protein
MYKGIKGILFIALLCCLSLIITNHSFASERIRMATTTSTDNSGLLEVILPPFEKMYGVTVDVIAVGTGKAIKLGESGNVDLILVHAPAAEERFVSEGHGVNRRAVMHNDFILLGPKNDPVQIKGNKDIKEAFVKIAQSGSLFISRGDDSGTHKKEKSIWKAAGIEPEGTWYLEAGQGMGTVIQMAHEKLAYTISDRGTFLAYRPKIDLIIISEGDKNLYNPYGVIAVNPGMHPQVKYVKAMTLIGWLTSPECQKMIGEFKKEGEVLFHPDAVPVK